MINNWGLCQTRHLVHRTEMTYFSAPYHKECTSGSGLKAPCRIAQAASRTLSSTSILHKVDDRCCHLVRHGGDWVAKTRQYIINMLDMDILSDAPEIVSGRLHTSLFRENPSSRRHSSCAYMKRLFITQAQALARMNENHRINVMSFFHFLG